MPKLMAAFTSTAMILFFATCTTFEDSWPASAATATCAEDPDSSGGIYPEVIGDLNNLLQVGLSVRSGNAPPTPVRNGNPAPEVIRQEVMVQLYVLSTDKASSQARTYALTPALQKLGFPYQVYLGVDSDKYANEIELMNQQISPMTDNMKKEWLQADFGAGQWHHGRTSESTPSNGGLACSLGHFHIWNLASQSHNQDEWTIILEDDAKLNPCVADAAQAIKSIVASAPSDVHLIHLDDRHCEGRTGVLDAHNINKWAPGSTAYAVTQHGARMLLSEPFHFAADHYLNAPVLHGKIKALCPGGPHIFLHQYAHASTMTLFEQGRCPDSS